MDNKMAKKPTEQNYFNGTIKFTNGSYQLITVSADTGLSETLMGPGQTFQSSCRSTCSTSILRILRMSFKL